MLLMGDLICKLVRNTFCFMHSWLKYKWLRVSRYAFSRLFVLSCCSEYTRTELFFQNLEHLNCYHQEYKLGKIYSLNCWKRKLFANVSIVHAHGMYYLSSSGLKCKVKNKRMIDAKLCHKQSVIIFASYLLHFLR